MTAIRTSAAYGRYTPTEYGVVLGTVSSWNGDQSAGVIYCHGAFDNAFTDYDIAARNALMRGLAAHATVHVGDYAYASFGNPTAMTRVGEGIAHLRSAWGQDGPVVMVGISMGAITALNYALLNPGEVSAVAGIVPGLDLADLRTRGMGLDATIDAAYPPAYNNATHGPLHSPVLFAGNLDADLPIHLWTASNDTLTVPATADAFVTARPQTGRTDLGALGHTNAAITAATADVVAFIEESTNP